MQPLPDHFEEAAPLLLPVLRPPSAPASAWRLARQVPHRAPLRLPFMPLLDLLLVVDQPRVRRFVSQEALDRWGVPVRTAAEAALANLPASGGLTLREDGLWSLASQDGYESSRLALPGWLEGFAHRVKGAPVAVVPHARALLVAGSADGDAVRRLLLEATRAWREAGEPLSPAPFTLNGRHVVPWDPPDGPLREAVRASRHALARREYRLQAEGLGGGALPDCEVAVGPRTGRAWSFARWPRDQEVLLPEVDLVVLEEPGRGAFLAIPWAALVEVGLLNAEPGLSPPRHRARWPERPLLEGLAARALPPDELL